MKTLHGILAAGALLGAVGLGVAAMAHDGRMGDGMGTQMGGRHMGEGPGMGGGMGPGFGRIDFAAIDVDGDGAATRAELVAFGTARLAGADADSDGVLTRAELVAAMPARPMHLDLFGADPAEAMADRILAMVGGTEAGSAPAAEIVEFRVNMLLTRADENADGALSADEAAGAGPRQARGGPDRPRF